MVYLLATILGLIGVVKASDTFIDQVISLAKRLKISSFVIGFTIVAFGTSLPELVTSLYSTSSGHTEIAISNVLGSNIANIGLVLATLAILKPYKLSKTDVFYNVPLNLITFSIFIGIVYLGGAQVGLIGGVALLLVFVFNILISRKNNNEVKVVNNIKFNMFIFLGSIAALVLLGKLSIDSILSFATAFNIEESILGACIIAVATSMPELIASLTAIKKGNENIGIGNILGSNLFNLFFVIGCSALIRPLNFSEFYVELGIIFLITVLLLVFAIFGKKYFFSRKEGFILLIIYTGFIAIQFLK